MGVDHHIVAMDPHLWTFVVRDLCQFVRGMIDAKREAACRKSNGMPRTCHLVSA